jgi:ribosomal protein S18 acetylase RimI-like enzyme
MMFMPIADIALSKIDRQHLTAVAKVHRGAFPQSALSQLGREAVRRYYEWLLTGPHEAHFIGAFEGERLLGFCVGGAFQGALAGFLRRNWMYLLFCLVRHPQDLRNPMFRAALRLALRSLLRVRKTKTTTVRPAKGNSFGILAIAVDPQAQKRHIGCTLMAEMERIARANVCKGMHLAVSASNTGARTFYEKLGWSGVVTTGQKNVHMQKTLQA